MKRKLVLTSEETRVKFYAEVDNTKILAYKDLGVVFVFLRYGGPTSSRGGFVELERLSKLAKDVQREMVHCDVVSKSIKRAIDSGCDVFEFDTLYELVSWAN